MDGNPASHQITARWSWVTLKHTAVDRQARHIHRIKARMIILRLRRHPPIQRDAVKGQIAHSRNRNPTKRSGPQSIL